MIAVRVLPFVFAVLCNSTPGHASPPAQSQGSARVVSADPNKSTLYFEDLEIRGESATGQIAYVNVHVGTDRVARLQLSLTDGGSPSATTREYTTTDDYKNTTVYVPDHLGSTYVTAHGPAHKLTFFTLDPYGGDLLQNGHWPLGSTETPYRLIGHERDESGLYEMGVRQYDPGIGRWLTPDPLFIWSPQKALESPREQNLYAYVKGNPIRLKDPSGLEAATNALETIRAEREGRPPDYARAQGQVSAGSQLRERMGDFVDMVRFVASTIVPSVVAGAAVAKVLIKALGPAAAPVAATTTGLALAVTGEAGVKSSGKAASQNKLAVSKGEGGGGTGGPKGESPTSSAPANRTAQNSTHGTFYVDRHGNVIPTPPGGHITSSPDGRFVQARDSSGAATGVRIDGPHKAATHSDPRAQQPHAHVPGVTNPDGTPWLPTKPEK